jgi:hypothetical protein
LLTDLANDQKQHNHKAILAAERARPVGQGLGAGIARALAAETTEDDLDRWQAIIRQIPLGRMGDPEADIGRAVVAVVSDDLAYLTGATLLLDGGRIMLP